MNPHKFALLLYLVIGLILCAVVWVQEVWPEEIPDKLWMGIISEDTSGDYEIYLSIASVVRNRLHNGLNLGIIALQRHDLIEFIHSNRLYVKRLKGVDLKEIVESAIKEVFIDGKDYANGADHYEHTGHYPVPSWARKMKVVKVLYPATKREITFWEEPR